MKKHDKERQRLVFSKKRLRLILLLTALSALLLYFSVALSPEFKYVRQFSAFFGYVSLVLALINLSKLFTREIRQELYRRISKALFGITEKLKAIVDKVKDKLGIKSAYILHSSDEVRIIINDDRRRARKQRPITKKRFNQLDDDRDRIRYMYVKFIEWKQKKLRNCHSFDTPRELEKKTAENDTEHSLFDLYTPVRYAQVPVISPEDVKTQYDYLTKNIKIK